MATIAFRADDELKKRLEIIADSKGITLSALIKLYLNQGMKLDLNEVTFSGRTVAEEMAVALENMMEEGVKNNEVETTPALVEKEVETNEVKNSVEDPQNPSKEIKRASDGGTVYNSAEELLASLHGEEEGEDELNSPV